MCLGIPMQIKQINGYSALCEARGIEREASLLSMLEDNLQIGDYVMISVGNIISRIDKKDAMIAWDLYDEMFATIDSSTNHSST
ncbi:MAG: HypC/HybG/HupF family hydrogenase formation chaperone [Gammaproteobacteria bacterium]|nr:HypC/HybG/HupF family hydrogenase formation chaperone [Gammaproteobacteria bacterium]